MKNNIWYLLSGIQLGGAEKRFIKMAGAVSQKGWFNNVNLLVNKEVHKKYLEDSECRKIIESNQLSFHFYEDFAPWYMKNRSQIYWSKKILKLPVPSFIKKIVQKYYNWYPVIKKIIQPNDIVHAVYGDPAQNAAVRFSTIFKNKCIVEITCPRTVCRKYDQYSFVNVRQGVSNLTVLCVSKVVFNIYSDLIGQDKSKWVVEYYRGPMLKDSLSDKMLFDHDLKENVIIFGHRFMPVKNAVIFAKAVSKLIVENKLSGWKVLFLGRGSDEKELFEILDFHISNGDVKVGWSTDLEGELKISKIFISIIGTGNIPSQSLFSAMSYSNLLLLSNTGNTKEMLGIHEGMVYSEINVEAIMDNLIKLKNMCDSDKFLPAKESVVSSYENIQTNFNYFTVLEEMYY